MPTYYNSDYCTLFVTILAHSIKEYYTTAHSRRKGTTMGSTRHSYSIVR